SGRSDEAGEGGRRVAQVEGGRMSTRLLTITEVATRLRLSRKNVYALVKAHMVYHRVSERRIVVPESSVDAYLRRTKCANASSSESQAASGTAGTTPLTGGASK